ncbi:MAG: YqeG family HAD IIIA-type phosphatase [Coriobacteriia bacterium]
MTSSPDKRGSGRCLRPDRYLTNVLAIEPDALASAGIAGLIIDLDNTLLPRDTSVVPDAFVAWLAEMTARFAVCFVSNNWHERVHEVAAELGVPLVARAVKPLPFAFLRALRVLGLQRRQVAVVGDQLFTDVLGGNLIGAMTILVEPLSRTDLPHTLLLRKVEARIIRGMTVEDRREDGL